MKKTFAVLSVVCLAGCEWNVREEPAPRRYEPPTYDPAPSQMPMPSSSSQPKQPTPPRTYDDDTSAEPYTCEGSAMDCGGLDSVSCYVQRGCTESLNDGSCFGSPTPCSWLSTEGACENQIGCVWTQ